MTAATAPASSEAGASLLLRVARTLRLVGLGAAVGVLLLLSLDLTPAAAQQRSGSTVLEFLAAVDRGDIDAALFKVLEGVEVTLPDGTKLTGKQELRPYLEAFPRPIEVVEHHNLRRMGHEAQIIAGGTPLLLRFRGALGIAAIVITEREPLARSLGPGSLHAA